MVTRLFNKKWDEFWHLSDSTESNSDICLSLQELFHWHHYYGGIPLLYFRLLYLLPKNQLTRAIYIAWRLYANILYTKSVLMQIFTKYRFLLYLVLIFNPIIWKLDIWKSHLYANKSAKKVVLVCLHVNSSQLFAVSNWLTAFHTI